ncbi:GGDEF domain-containing protein [Vibrio europaeus]|uniref:GGDEF domain-containing protein n=1 Tax=Vibrio europaeus TaxID=300876 RepID=UPI0039DF63CD
MEDKIIQSVVEITEQRNSVSLGHCLVATLAEMTPAQSIELTYFINNTAKTVAKVTRSSEQKEFDWIYDSISAYSGHRDHLNDNATISVDEKDRYVSTHPIPVSEDSSAELTVILQDCPSSYALLIDGFAKIYRNYLAVLHDSERDKLTGLLNRKTLEERLARCFNVMPDTPVEITAWVAIIDLDHFKQVNDRFGHMIGDEILLMFAQQMSNYFIGHEQLFRYGGEEFVVLLPQQSTEECRATLEGFRRHIESFRFPQINNLTFSCGVCGITPHEYMPTILDHADSALYYVKEHGRNQVHFFDAECLDRYDNGENDVELF